MMFSCQQAEDPTMDKAQEPIVKTRAYGDKTPKVTIYVELGLAKETPIGYAVTEEIANILLAEYNNNPWDIDREKVTLVVLYQRNR